MFCTKLSYEAVIPCKSYETDAGYDLFSCHKNNIIIKPNETKLIPTGIKITGVPTGYYGRIAPRSGLSVKQNITVGAGVVDSSYTGEIKICIHNLSSTNDFIVKNNDKIAQLIITKCYNNFSFTEVSNEIFDSMCLIKNFEEKSSSRGENGFGSTG